MYSSVKTACRFLTLFPEECTRYARTRYFVSRFKNDFFSDPRWKLSLSRVISFPCPSLSLLPLSPFVSGCVYLRLSSSSTTSSTSSLHPSLRILSLLCLSLTSPARATTEHSSLRAPSSPRRLRVHRAAVGEPCPPSLHAHRDRLQGRVAETKRQSRLGGWCS